MVRVNKDGSITVGVLRDEKEIVPEEKKETPAPKAEKKPTKKKQ